MPHHTSEQIHAAADRLQHQLDDLDPTAVEVEDTTDLRAIAEAVDAVKASDAAVRERVQIARARGRSWNRIAVALGVSRQAARERFTDRVQA